MTLRHLTAACVLAAATLVTGVAGSFGAQAPGAPGAYAVVSRDGRRPLPVRSIGGQEMFALDDLARLFSLSLREDPAAGGLTVSAGAQTIVLSAGQPLASVGGRLISLPAAPVHQGRAWFVPLDFVPRALAPALGTRIELRKPSRLVLVGDVRLPQVGVRVEALGTAARVTIDVAPATPHTVTQEGNRINVRFTADAIDATFPASPVPDLVLSVHPGDTPASVVVDLGPRFASFRAADSAADRGAGVVTLDIAAQAVRAPQTAAPPAPATPEPPPLVDLSPVGGLRTIVIDAGHGGDEDGARGPGGTLEKNLTISVARRLKAALEARLGVRVILTRDADRNVGLDERAAIANNNKADLFISLHANASVRQAMSGAQVFYLSLDDYGEEAQRVAHGQAEPVPVFGGGVRDIEVTLWEMAQARYIDRSAALAAAAESALREHVAMSPRALQQAPLRVLVGANMPAILVEMAFLTNPQQEHDASTDAFQNGVVQGLVDAVVRFRDSGAGRAIGAAPPALPSTVAGGRE